MMFFCIVSFFPCITVKLKKYLQESIPRAPSAKKTYSTPLRVVSISCSCSFFTVGTLASYRTLLAPVLLLLFLLLFFFVFFF